MRDIYLIDFENVASEGLSGITYLSEEDQVIIFYSNNSNRLTMKMHILIGKSICNLNYFEVTVGGKNALDHQISTYLGYLMGTNAAERNYYIVSRDMGYKHVANFWASQKIGPRVRCIDTIKGASRLERNRREAVLQPLPQEPQPEAPVLGPQTVPAPLEAAPALPEQVDAPAADLAAESLPVDEPVAEAAAEASVIEPIQESTEDAATETESPEEAPLETSEPEPERSAEPETAESAEPKPESQRRLNRNRPRPRGRYRRNSNTAETKVAAEESPTPAAPLPEPQEPKPAQKETAEHTEESAEKKAAPRKRPGTKKQAPLKQETVNLDQLSSLIAPYPKLQENVLRDLIANNKRQVLCNTLRKHLGQEKGLALYNEIKKSAWH